MDAMDVDIQPASCNSAEEPSPSELNTASQGHCLEVSKDKLTVRYTGDGRHSNDVGSIQANRPVPTKRLVYYYELTVIDQGEAGRVAIGFADKSFKLTRQPGWEPNSYGFHGDDGRKYSASGKGEEYGPTFGTGDTVGAGIHLGKQEMFFTKNGSKLKTAFKNVKGQLYPTIGLHSKNECVEVNFGQKPFKFDLEGMISDERAAQQAALERIHVPPGMTHHIVRKYLLHYGYADTLHAFDEAAGMTDDQDTSRMAVDDDELALLVRKDVRQRILTGDVDGALAAVQVNFPQLLAETSGFDDLRFHLHTQQFIELVRTGAIQQAVVFAQTVLSALHQRMAHMEPALRDVVALIAYEQPETSSLGHLMTLMQREAVADVANAAILSVASGHGPGHTPRSGAEQLLRQLAVVHATLLEHNEGQGEVFRLKDHLLPPS